MRLLPRFLRVFVAPGYLKPPSTKGPTVLDTLRQKAAEAAKALIAVATPIITSLVIDLMGDLTAWAVAAIAAGATGAAVWLVPNRPPA